METTETIPSWEQLAQLVLENSVTRVEDYLHSFTPAETARTVSRLDEETQNKLLLLLSPEEAATCCATFPMNRPPI